MDERERSVKLKKLTNLDEIYIQVMYFRLLGKTVSDIQRILQIPTEKTIWKRFTRIYEVLEITGNDKEGELIREYSPLFLEFFKSEDDLKNWGHIRAEMLRQIDNLSSPSEAVSLPENDKSDSKPESTEPQETKNTPVSDSIASSTPPNNSEKNNLKTPVQGQKSRLPWIVVAIPLLVLCLLFIAGILFLSRFIQASANIPTVQATQTSASLIQDTSTPVPSITVQPMDIQILPTSTLTATLTITPTETLTPIPTDTKSPLGLTKGDELGDNRVSLKLTDIQYNQHYDRLGAKIAPISFFFDFTNHSGETIILQFDSSNFQFVDNTGYQADCWFYNISGAGTKVNEPLNNGDTRQIIARCGLGTLNPSVNTVTLTIHPFSSLPESTWVIAIPH